MATSGSTGGFKFAVLPKAALLASARAVVDHCSLGSDDVWLAGLSDFHVGGLGILARAYVAGSRVQQMREVRWRKDGKHFLDEVESAGATLTSLTPTHLYDLVRVGARAPDSLRGVLLGGGPIRSELVERAQNLGWPVWPSYGMTEACSQIATSLDGETIWLPILPAWRCRSASDSRLEIRGEPLFSGYAIRGENGWNFDSARDERGWFLSGDRCEISEGTLRFLGRADDLVKVSGELVSLSAVENAAAESARARGYEIAVTARPDRRRGHEFIAFVGEGAQIALDEINENLNGLERISRLIQIDELPRTEIGKIDRGVLKKIAAAE